MNSPLEKYNTAREEYAKLPYVSFSGLSTFLKCGRLFYERFITRENVQEQKDYFVYGSLVDCLVTEPAEVDNRFVKVSRTSNGGTMELEAKLQALEAEVVELKPKVDAGNKTAIKGTESRLKTIQGIKEEIESRNALAGRTQVPGSIWDNAHETAKAILENPYLIHLKGSYDMLAQVTMVDHQVKRKGIADLVFYNGKGEYVIVDIKTTWKFSELDPEMYAGQLSFYRELLPIYLSDHPELPKASSISCVAIVGDKEDGKKMCQDFIYSEETLTRHLTAVLDIETVLNDCMDKDLFFSSKEVLGREQKCFTCSVCSVRPFSKDINSVVV